MYQKRLEEIENELAHNRLHKKLMDLMAATFGITTAKALSTGTYVSVVCDVICVILAAIAVSMTEEDDKELLLEKASIQETQALMEQWK